MHGRKNRPNIRPGGHTPSVQHAGASREKAIPLFLTVQPDGVLLAIKLQPRASKNEIGQPLGAELRIKVSAPPVDSAANEALIRLLAETLDCPRNKVELLRGHTSHHKTVKIHGVTATPIMAKLAA